MKPASLLAAIILDLVAIAHVLRLVFHTEVTVGGTVIPMWVSGVGCVVAAVLSVLVLREARSSTA
jgi:protein-S-isoprenylcysteine O-methyltransferase Ste14